MTRPRMEAVPGLPILVGSRPVAGEPARAGTVQAGGAAREGAGRRRPGGALAATHGVPLPAGPTLTAPQPAPRTGKVSATTRARPIQAGQTVNGSFRGSLESGSLRTPICHPLQVSKRVNS